MNKGFTLIELLVVVLIIGILATVAWPQYQKAVRKSRFASLKPVAKALHDAQEIYYNENGHYLDGEDDIDLLDIQVPESYDVELSTRPSLDYIRIKHDKLDNKYTVFLDHSKSFAGNIYCEALTGNKAAEDLCVAERGAVDQSDQGYTMYLLSGNSSGIFPAIYSPTACSGFYRVNCATYTFSNGSRVEFEQKWGNQMQEWNPETGMVRHWDMSGQPAGKASCVSGPGCSDFGTEPVSICMVYPALPDCIYGVYGN